MELTRGFEGLTKNDADIAGGKGASLGEMTQAGIPVPPGYVVLASTFERFLEETDLNVEIEAILATVDHEAMHTVEHASETIQALIHGATMPADIGEEITAKFKTLGAEFVAVRSSATAEDSASAAWAGQLDSYLNTTEAELLLNVQRCWASLFTPRAIFYRFEKGLDTTKISVAVVVQKMVNSDAAGIAFSVHPVTEDHNQLIIEAGFGLGEAVVSGQVTPDSYVVTKEPREIIDKNISEQSRGLFRKEGGGNEWRELGADGERQVITDEQILALSESVCGIERHYGFPCDIEWALEGSNFYIVQSRPITTLSSHADTIEAVEPFPHAYDQAYWHQFGRWVQKPFPASFWPTYVRSNIPGQLYPGHRFTTFLDVEGYFHSSNDDLLFLKDHLKSQLADGTLLAFVGQFERMGSEIEVRYREMLAAATKGEGTIGSCLAVQEEMCAYWSIVSLLGEVLTATALEAGVVESELDFLDRVRPYLRKSWIEEEEAAIRAIASRFSELGSENVIAHDLEPERMNDPDLREMLEAYFRKYHWVGINKWESEPQSAEKCAARVTEAITNLAQGNYVESHTESADEPHPLISLSASAAYWRATCAGLADQLAYTLRGRLAALGKAHGLSYGETLLMTVDEIVDLEKGLQAVEVSELKDREEGVALYLTNENRVGVVSRMETRHRKLFELYAHPASIQSGNELVGTPACKGNVRAYASVIAGQADFSKFQDGNILVTSETTPAFVPLMRKAAAILTERGGITSHAAIVSRELGIPCVISIAGLMSRVKDGDLLQVDANVGAIEFIGPTTREITILSKVYGREKPLFYFVLWQADDKKAIKAYLDEDLKDDLFVVPPPGQSGSIWYSNTEFERLSEMALEKVNSSDEFVQGLVEHARHYWELLVPYLAEKKRCSTADEMYTYYQNLVDFWMPMNSVFFLLPDKPNISPIFKEGILALRAITQEYTEEMPRVFTDFFAMRFPELTHLGYYATPEETVRLDKELEPELIKELESRAEGGCFMFEGVIYPLAKLDAVLSEHHLTLEKIEAEGTTSFTGQSAYKGKVTGPARLVLSKSDTKKMKPGDILVAPMTNPDFVPYMKIAGAIVTDEGGLTCHAAIASREMRVPCVIGTKVATVALQDGDVVEVDANTGIVRIISGA
jgi:phosphoenolpyruvate synthase/pyruvate phosphate dikinase